jgi:hypothetical protein
MHKLNVIVLTSNSVLTIFEKKNHNRAGNITQNVVGVFNGQFKPWIEIPMLSVF